MNKPIVSIIVPVYNNVSYLRQCFDSLINQTLRDIEIILVDDGSPNIKSAAICDEYANRDSRVRVIHQENHGAGYAINRGIEAARADYIGEVDCDDFIEPIMYEVLMSEACGADVVKASFMLHEQAAIETMFPQWPSEMNGKEYNTLEADKDEQMQIICSTPSMWSCVYRKEFLTENGIRMRETPGAAFQDTAFSLKTKIFAKRFKCLNVCLYHYRIDNEASSTHNHNYLFALPEEYDDVERMLKKRGVNVWEAFARVKLNGYQWMYGRLTDEEEREQFAIRMMEDVNREYHNPEYYTEAELRFINSCRK